MFEGVNQNRKFVRYFGAAFVIPELAHLQVCTLHIFERLFGDYSEIEYIILRNRNKNFENENYKYKNFIPIIGSLWKLATEKLEFTFFPIRKNSNLSHKKL